MNFERDYVRRHRLWVRWKRLAMMMAMVVVFCTTYALVIPAITMGQPVCGMKEHIHNDNCYEERNLLICDLEEGSGHLHGETCFYYEEQIVCERIMHIHGDSCYKKEDGNPEENGDVKADETPENGENTKNNGGSGENGDVRKDKYLKESRDTANNEDPEENEDTGKNGDIKDAGNTANNENPGENEDTGNTANNENSGENAETGKDRDEETGNTGGSEENRNIETDYAVENEEDQFPGRYLTMTAMMPMGLAMPPDYADMSPYIKNISGSGTTYAADGDYYKTQLKIEFDYTKPNVIRDHYQYQQTFPPEIRIPEGLFGRDYDLLDEVGSKSGSYRFVRDADGTERLEVVLDSEYVGKVDEEIHGFIQFEGTIGGEKQQENGGLQVSFGSGLDLVIPPEELQYDGDSTRNYDIDTEKSGSYMTEGDRLVYTVYVSSKKGTADPILLKDILSAEGLTVRNLENVTVTSGTCPVYNGWSGNRADGAALPDTAWQYSYQNGELNMVLPGLPAGVEKQDGNQTAYLETSYYKIEYSYKLDEVPSGSTFYPKNIVKVSSEDPAKKEKVEDTASFTVGINKTWSLKKNGWYDSTNGRVCWTITVNDNHQNIAGSLVTDTMFDRLPPGTEPVINASDGNDGGYQIQKDIEGKVTGILFTRGSNGTNTNQYTITYYTDAEANWDGTTFKNTAVFDRDGNPETKGDQLTGSADVPVSGGSLAKTYEGAEISPEGTSAEVTWSVNITFPAGGLAAGTVLQEQINPYDWAGKQYLTREQTLEWDGLLHFDNGDTRSLLDEEEFEITWEASDGKTYSWQEISRNAGGFHGNLTYGTMRILLKRKLELPAGVSSARIFYKTTADLTNWNEQYGEASRTFYNRFLINDKSAEATYTYYKGSVIKTNGNDQTGTTAAVNEDGRLTWKIKTTVNSGGNHRTMTITDTLPDKVSLENLKYEWTSLEIKEDGSITGSQDPYVITGSYKGQLVVLTVEKKDGSPLEEGKTITITYGCKIDEDVIKDTVAGTKVIFTNHAVVTTDRGEYGSSTQTQEWTRPKKEDPKPEYLSKTGRWNKDSQQLQYSVVINPEGEDLIPGSDTLTLKDVLTYQPGGGDSNYTREFSLVQSSVKLYQGWKDEKGNVVKGSQIRDWTWTYEEQWDGGVWSDCTSTITAVIPDNTPLIFEYNYNVSVSKPDPNWTDPQLTARNAVTIEGTSYGANDNQYGTQWQASSTSGQISGSKSYIFNKVDVNSYGITLDGAEFTVYRYEGVGKEGADSQGYVPAGITYTTKNGSFLIQWKSGQYEAGRMYCIRETKAPEGYLLPGNLQTWYFYWSKAPEGSGNTAGAGAMPAVLPANAVNLSVNGASEYVPNERNVTRLQVDKRWFDAQGNDVTAMQAGAITFRLYQKEQKTDAGSGSGGSGSGSGGSLSGDVTLDGKICYGGFVENYNIWQSIGTVSKPAGTKVTFQVTDLYGDKGDEGVTIFLNGQKLTPTISSGEFYVSWSNVPYPSRIYTYTCTLNQAANEITGYISNWNSGDWSFTEPVYQAPAPTPAPGNGEDGGDAPKPEGILYGTYSITQQDGWHWSSDSLPAKGRDAEGNPVQYVYYVEEQSTTNYTVQYDNNGGISGGTITIRNRKMDTTDFELPATGYPGWNLYKVLGLLLMAGGFWIICRSIAKRYCA